MKKIKMSKDTIALIPIIILSAILNFWNLSIEGYGNSYYAAAVKSMTLSLKNFFFVSFDPSGFVTIDKPPVGFWLQAVSAKIFGFSGVSILLPQALAGVISVIIIYIIVKRAFGNIAGLLSALFLAVTPVFVAASRNNTIDNVLVMVLLFACWAVSIAAERKHFKFLIICMVLIGIGFNVKMLQAYLVVPAVYVTYMLCNGISLKKRIIHLMAGTLVLVVVSLSWAFIVDLVPASSRPYVDSSTNNTVMELILGHNGSERLSFSSNSNNGGGAPSGGGQGKSMGTPPSGSNQNGGGMGNPPSSGFSDNNGGPGSNNGSGKMGGGPGGNNGFDGGDQMGGNSGGNGGSLSGSFGGQTTAGFQRLFSKNILSDQIVWFIPLALLGFIAAAIREKLTFRLDNRKKQALALWFMWFLPEFIYFSFNTGTFHSYYLTMLAPPAAALAAIGITTMWELYKEGSWKAWFLPVSLMINGAVHLLMLYYFISYSDIIKVLIVLVVLLNIVPSIILCILNIKNMLKPDSNETLKLKKTLVSLALSGILVTPFAGSVAVLFTSLNSSFPAAGLELLSSSGQGNGPQGAGSSMKGASRNSTSSNSKFISFLLKNKTTEKYLLAVSSSNDAADIIINTGESVMSLGGFLGNNNAISLAEFKQMVKNGEIRYVMVGGDKGNGSSSAIMNWVKSAGTLVSSSEYSDTNASADSNSSTSNASDNGTNILSQQSSTTANSKSGSQFRDGGNSSQQLYDLKNYTNGTTK